MRVANKCLALNVALVTNNMGTTYFIWVGQAFDLGGLIRGRHFLPVAEDCRI